MRECPQKSRCRGVLDERTFNGIDPKIRYLYKGVLHLALYFYLPIHSLRYVRPFFKIGDYIVIFLSGFESSLVALFSKKKAPPAKAKTVTPVNDELAKLYGPDRRIYLTKGLLDRDNVPTYLTKEAPGDYGYNPFGLNKKPDNLGKYQADELIHARWAMLGVVGFIIHEAFN